MFWRRATSIDAGKHPPLSARHSAQYRQGDLLFVSRPALPRRVRARTDDVIVRGELTGHAHRLVDGLVFDGSGPTVYLEVGPGGRVVHEEHDPLELPVGVYVVIRQREYRGEDEGRHVRD